MLLNLRELREDEVDFSWSAERCKLDISEDIRRKYGLPGCDYETLKKYKEQDNRANFKSDKEHHSSWEYKAYNWLTAWDNPKAWVWTDIHVHASWHLPYLKGLSEYTAPLYAVVTLQGLSYLNKEEFLASPLYPSAKKQAFENLNKLLRKIVAQSTLILSELGT